MTDPEDVRRRFEEELLAWTENGGLVIERDPDDTLREVVDQARRMGVPATGAYFEEDCIVVEVAEPRGHG